MDLSRRSVTSALRFVSSRFVRWTVLLVTLASAPAHAAGSVVEVDAAAESMFDARVMRRLVALELSEIEVPAGPNPAPRELFYRVLGLPERRVRVELWDRGALFDSRVVSAVQGQGHLLTRRVALAAAELARRLRQRRITERRQHERELARRAERARLEAMRTREGPLALRTEIDAQLGRGYRLFGPALTAEISLRRSLRLDLGVRYAAGWDASWDARFAWSEIVAGPALRLHATHAFDIDVGALIAASAVHVIGATAVDAIGGQRDTWSARAAFTLRAQPRLTRAVRATIGFEAGGVLRPIPAELANGSSERYRGLYAGIALGAVLTPR